jgi:SAM-dependent methyltransferase
LSQATREYQQEFYDRHFAARAAAAEDQYSHPLFCSFYDRLARRAYDLGPGSAATSARVLEIGCGEGLLGAAFARVARERALELDYTGVDLSASGLDQARPHIQGQLLCGDAVEIVSGLADARYDVITIKNLLHHIDDPAALLRQAHRARAPGGAVLVIEPTLWSIWVLLLAAMAPRREKYFFRGEGRNHDAVRAAGLEIAHRERFSWLPWELFFGIRYDWFRRPLSTANPRVIRAATRLDEWCTRRFGRFATYDIWAVVPRDAASAPGSSSV